MFLFALRNEVTEMLRPVGLLMAAPASCEPLVIERHLRLRDNPWMFPNTSLPSNGWNISPRRNHPAP